MNYYYPKRPVKSFQDLEVYQKTLAVAVMVAKRLLPEVANQSERVKQIGEKVLDNLLSLPVLIASAHSLRFGDQGRAIITLEETMLNCNLAVVYLELYRDLASQSRDCSEIANESLPKLQGQGNEGTGDQKIGNNIGSGTNIFFEEQIKSLLLVRMKIMHLQRSWKKFMSKE